MHPLSQLFVTLSAALTASGRTLASRRDDESGQGTLEYVGIAIVAAILVTAVVSAVTGADIGGAISSAISRITGAG